MAGLVHVIGLRSGGVVGCHVSGLSIGGACVPGCAKPAHARGPASLGASVPPRPGSGAASGCFIRAGVLLERVFYWGAFCAGGGCRASVRR